MSDSTLMQAFFDSTEAVFYIKDAEGRFLLVNRKGAELLDLSEAECVGKTAYDLAPKADADAATRADREVRESGKPSTLRHQVTLPTGRRTLLEFKFPISIPEHPGALAGISIDVTDEP